MHAIRSIDIPFFSDTLYHHHIAALVAVLFGLCIGRFLNIVIDRLPVMIHQAWDNYLAQATNTDTPHPETLHLFRQGRQCRHCQAAFSVWHIIPVFGSLMRCAACHQRPPYRYLAVELICALLSGLLIWIFGTGLTGLSALCLIYFLIALCFIDIETMLLPDTLTLPLLWIGLLVNLNDTFAYTEDAIIGAAAGYSFLWLMHWIYKKATGQDGIGYGDFKLLAALGAWLGWQILPLLMLCAAVCGLLVSIVLLMTRRLQKNNPIPFGPYLALSGILALLFGPALLSVLF